MLLTFTLITFLSLTSVYAQQRQQQPVCSLATFDRCGPAEQEPGQPSTCNATIEVAPIPSRYSLQCRQDRSLQAGLNYATCLNAIVDICNRLTDPHALKNQWVWTSPAYIGCAFGFWLPLGNGSDAAFAPSYDRCVVGIFQPMAQACTNPQWNNVGGVNLKTFPGRTTSGEAVDSLYPSYVIAPSQLTT